MAEERNLTEEEEGEPGEVPIVPPGREPPPPIEREPTEWEEEPEPEPKREPLVPPEEPAPPVEVAPELKHLRPQIEKAREEQAARRREEQILQAHRERQAEAEQVAEREGISTIEAMAKIGAPVPKYMVKQAKERRLEATKIAEVAKDYSKMSSKEQFEALVKLGRIPKGSEFAPGTAETKGQWSYIVPEELQRVKEFERTHTELKPGVWYANSELAWLSLAQKRELKETGQYTIPETTIAKGIGMFPLEESPEETYKTATNWFEKIKNFLGLTSEGIAEAQVRYLTTPPIPESKGTRKLSAREMLSILVPTIKSQPVETKEISFKDALKATYEAEKKKVELATKGLGLTVAYRAPEVRTGIREFAEPLPKPLEEAVKFGGALFLGAASAPIYSAIVGGHLAKVTWAPDKISELKDLGKGIASFFISIPATIAAEPALALGEYTGLFIVGPEGAVKIVKSVGARGVPAYIPKRGMGIEYSVVKVPAKIAKKREVIVAVNEGITRAMRNKSGTAIVRIGDGKVRLRIKPTPVSEVVGPALYHATPALTKALGKGQIKGTLYASPHLAIRFAESSAKGEPQVNPAILMIHTKDSKVKWSPTTNLYKGTKEMEAVYGKTKLEPVKSLWHRLTFGKAGDFITTHKGTIIPIYRFKEPGAIAPAINLADLVAIRIRSIQASLTDLVKGRRGIEILVEPRNVISRRIVREAWKEVKKGKDTTDAYTTVLRREVRRVTERNSRLLERLYRERPEFFERTYTERLEREFRQIARERPAISRRAITQLERTFERERTLEVPRAEIRRLRKQAELRRLRERVARQETILGRIRPVPESERPVRRTLERRDLLEQDLIERDRLRLDLRDDFRKDLREDLREDLIEKTMRERAKKEEKRPSDLEAKGAIAWRQGFVWWVIYPPYKSRSDVRVLRKPPEGATVVKGIGSAYKTIQALGGDTDILLTLDMGAFDVTITRPRKAGAKGTIRYTRDIRGKTKSDISLAGVRT